jgi:SAM-dependent methyltransferase/uncharacterized protein YbaR (Trm112 family)
MDDLLELLRSRFPPNALGVEVGAHSLPVSGITPYYVDRVLSFAGVESQIDIQADTLALPIPTGELDYLCSSHVLEHLVDPIAGLLEWQRVLRPDGLLYLVVPDKRFTFDEPRALTPSAHIVEDFHHMATETEREHVREFIYDTDWNRLQPAVAAEEVADRQKILFGAYIKDIENGNPVDIHHHTFTPDSLVEVLTKAGLIEGSDPSFEVEAHAEKYPPYRSDGIGCLLRKISRTQVEQSNETFALARSPARRPIRLVCPATLAPLDLTSRGQTQSVLKARGFNHTFAFHGDIPVLLPPPGVQIERPWRDSAWRNAKLSSATGASTR